MGQFPSIVARRTHKLSHGLYQQYPDPGDACWTVDASSYDRLLPPLPRFLMAGMCRRYLTYGAKYAAMVDRYYGSESWPGIYLPDACNGAACQTAATNLLSYYHEQGAFYPLILSPQVGQTMTINNLADQEATVTEVDQPWTVDDAWTSLLRGDGGNDDWQWQPYGGFATNTNTFPGTYYTAQPKYAGPVRLYDPPGGDTIRAGAYASAGGDVTISGYIYAVLYGKVPIPSRPWILSTLLDTPDGIGYQSAYMDLINVSACRVIWQMTYIAIMLQEDDALCRNAGGRGGEPRGKLTQAKQNMGPPPITPQPNPPGRNWWTRAIDALNAGVDGMKLHDETVLPYNDPEEEDP